MAPTRYQQKYCNNTLTLNNSSAQIPGFYINLQASDMPKNPRYRFIYQFTIKTLRFHIMGLPRNDSKQMIGCTGLLK